jgi:aspartate/methionine/tyrosine aminotransferase
MLEGMGCEFSKNQAGLFVWAKVPADITDGYALSDLLLYNANVFVTPGGIFGNAGKNYIRVSLCAPEDKILESLDRIKKGGFIKSKQHV